MKENNLIMMTDPPGQPSIESEHDNIWLEGRNGSVFCNTTDGGYPESQYSWYLNDVYIGAVPQMYMVVNRTHDGATLTCNVSNNYTTTKRIQIGTAVRIQVQCKSTGAFYSHDKENCYIERI